MSVLSRTLAVAVLVPLALGGCSAASFLGGSAEPGNAYELHASLDGPVARGQQSSHLIVERPAASAAIDTDGILIRPGPTQVFYDPDGRWIEAAPLMVQTALVDGLDRTGAFLYVGRRPFAAGGNYVLVTSISEFFAEIAPDEKTATVHVQITARIVREDNAEVVSSKTFVASAPTADTRTAAIVDGFDRAATQVFDTIIDWVLRSRGIRVAERPPS